MTFDEYRNKHPLTRNGYSHGDVEKIRRHAFLAGTPEKKETRSQKQNRYYWGCVVKLCSDHTGFTPDEMHQILAEKILSYERVGKRFVLSTTKLKTNEFESYMEDCRRFAATELHVYVPLPNEPDSFFYSLEN